MSDYKALQALRERIEHKRDEAERELQVVITAMELLRTEKLTEEVADPRVREEDEFVAELRKKKTQVHALVAIAKKNNGKLLTKDAKRLLQRAKLMKQTKNASNILYNVINRSEKFRNIGYGEYELIDTVPTFRRIVGRDLDKVGEMFPEPKPIQ
jgi:hypothetical protein